MKKLAIALLAVSLAGCANMPKPLPSQVNRAVQPQVNRAAKADKYAAPKQPAVVEQSTPNQTVKKRWQWPHPKWFH